MSAIAPHGDRCWCPALEITIRPLLLSARLSRCRRSREGGETDGERHAGDRHCREANAEVRRSRPGDPVDFPGTTCLPLPAGRVEEQGVRSKAHRQKKKPLASDSPAPPPRILAEPHFPESRGPKGKPRCAPARGHGSHRPHGWI